MTGNLRNKVSALPEMCRVLPLLCVTAVASLLVLPGCSEKPREVALSDTSKEVVQKIKAPVEIRFYHGTEANTPAAKLQSHARELLNAYAVASGGNIKLSEVAITNASMASEAIADGIKPFNIEKGDAAFLGVVMQSGDKKEVLPVLSPDFVSALEADVTRALERIQAVQSAEQAVSPPETVPGEVIERVKSVVPNYKDVPLEQGEQVLRENMLSDLHKAGSDLEARIAGIRSKVADASPAEQAAMREEITKAEIEHAEKLKRIIQGSTAELKALQELKSKP